MKGRWKDAAIHVKVCLCIAIVLYSAGAGIPGSAGAAEPHQAPTIDGSYSPTFPDIDEDSLGDEGVVISDLVDDTISATTDVQGIAVIGITGSGTWQWKDSGDGPWWTIDEVGDETARMIHSEAKLRFVPAADWHGTATITYRAWDRSNDEGATHLAQTIHDVGANGGDTPYSADSQTASVVVHPINDAPDVIFPQTPKVLSFDGANTYSLLNNLSLKGEMTFEAWVYGGNPYSTWSRLFDFGNGAPGQNIMVGFKSNSGHMFMHNYTLENSSSEILSSEVFPSQTWVHVAVTIDSSGEGKMYWDGVLKASGNVGTIVDIARSHNYIGASNWTQDAKFNGKMRDIRFWNKARTISDIEETKNTILTGSEDGLVGYLPMLEGEGNLLNDLTGKEITGDIYYGDTVVDTGEHDPWVEDPEVPVAIFILEDHDTEQMLHGTYVIDPDADDTANTEMILSIEVPLGSIHIDTSGVNVTNGANDSSSIAIQGSKMAINDALSALAYTPPADYFGVVNMNFDVSDSGYTGAGGTQTSAKSLYIMVQPVNDPPTISAIDDQVLPPGESTDELPFTVGDIDNAAESLDVTAASGNADLVTVPNIALSGSGADRTVAVTPETGQLGFAVITLTVSDGAAQSSESFRVAVAGHVDLDGWTGDGPGGVAEDVYSIGQTLPLGAKSTMLAFSMKATVDGAEVELALANPDTYMEDGYKLWTADYTLPAISLGSQTVTFTASDKNDNELDEEPVENTADNDFIFCSADLSALTLPGGRGLTPTFAPGTVNYTVSVGNSVSTFTVTPTAADSTATVKVNGVAVTSGQASGAISLSVGSNTITVEVTALNGTKKTYTVIVTRDSASVGSPSAGGTTPGATEIITVDVEASGQGVVSQTEIERTTNEDGTKSDKVVFAPGKATESVEKTLAAGASAVRIIIPDPRDEVKEVRIDLPLAALQTVLDSGLDLEIFTDNGMITIPNASLSGIDPNLYFHVVPIKKEDERLVVEERAKKEELVREVLADGTIKVVARPMTIETNMSSRRAHITLPLSESLVPTDEQERERFLSRLAIFIEHTDGDKDVIRPQIGPYAPGILGLSFTIEKFSTFTILDMQGEAAPSHQAYIRGYPDGLFKPENPLTRAEMATIISRVVERSGTAAVPDSYPDVADSHWAVEAIGYSWDVGLMTGYPDGTFRPGRAITRAEMAAIAARWANLDGPAEGSYADAQGHWAEQVIAQVHAAGYMDGYPDGTFKPDQAITRAEAVTVINRLLNRGPLYGIEQPSWADAPANYWAHHDIEEASQDHNYFRRSEGGEMIVE